MVYIHVKKPKLSKLYKTKDGLVKTHIKRESSTSKIYDKYVNHLDAAYSQQKKNYNQTGDPNKKK